MAPLLLGVTPLGYRTETYDDLYVASIPVYPDSTVESGKALRYARYASPFNVYEAAALLGVPPIDVVNLEKGAKVFATDVDRTAYLRALNHGANVCLDLGPRNREFL